MIRWWICMINRWILCFFLIKGVFEYKWIWFWIWRILWNSSNKNYFRNDGKNGGVLSSTCRRHHGQCRVPNLLWEPGYFGHSLILFRHLQAGFPLIKYQNYQNCWGLNPIVTQQNLKPSQAPDSATLNLILFFLSLRNFEGKFFPYTPSPQAP